MGYSVCPLNGKKSTDSAAHFLGTEKAPLRFTTVTQAAVTSSLMSGGVEARAAVNENVTPMMPFPISLSAASSAGCVVTAWMTK
jgi:hypothetical protein